MPFGIYQDDVKVATVKVVLARDLVCAAQIENDQAGHGAEDRDRAAVQWARSDRSGRTET